MSFFGAPEGGGAPLAPHAPAYAREYTQTLFVGVTKKCRVPWRLPGTVWLWSTKPAHVQVPIPRLDLDPVGSERDDWPGGKIPLVFPPHATPCFKTIDVVVSAAPPEFSNARRYVLRFHLTYVDPTSHACAPVEVAGGPETAGAAAAEAAATRLRLEDLEKMATTERLLQLNRQCAELHAQRLASPAPTVAPPSPRGRDADDLERLKAELASLNDVLRSSFLGGEASVTRPGGGDDQRSLSHGPHDRSFQAYGKLDRK